MTQRKDEVEQAFENELGDVQPCDCGGFNLSMGPLSLHFEPEEAEALVELVTEGRAFIDGGRRPRRQRRVSSKARAGGTFH